MTPAVFFDATLLGFEYALLAVGIFITFKVLDMADLTVDGSFCLGMAVSGVFTVQGMPVIGLVLGMIAGALAGCVTGVLASKARINPLIAGIITSTGLYSINIFILGAPNVSLLGVHKAFTYIGDLIPKEPIDQPVQVARVGIDSMQEGLLKQIFVIGIVVIAVLILIAYFKTENGLAMRAVGDNEDMSSASSINVDAMKIGGLALANALVALSGGILAQCQGFADMSSGTGMVLVGLASVIIGEVFGGKRSVTAGLICSVIGSIVYRWIIQFALGVNLLDANGLKLMSALIVGIFMAFPAIKAGLQERNSRRKAYSELLSDNSAIKEGK